jgi:hypothetical protein
MKTFKSLSLMLLAMTASVSIFAQTADEVIAKHIDAIGGKDNWKKVNSMKMEATVTTQGMDIPVTIYQVHNKAQKQEINVMNMTGYSILTNDGGWNYMPFMGQTAPEPMTADEVSAGKEGLDIQGELLDYKDKGHSVQMLGKEDIEGTECYKLKLTRKSGRESTYFIDTKTNYIVRSASKLKVNGQEVEQVMNLSNYQKLPGGIVVPMTMENSGMPAPINISKVEVNPTIDNAIFEVKK